jgi:hypothetical protein
MTARHAKLMFVLLIVLVTLLFFVHVPNGGFQSKNGPTTPTNKLQLLVVSLLLLVVFARSSAPLLALAWSSLARLGGAPLSVLRSSIASASLRC